MTTRERLQDICPICGHMQPLKHPFICEECERSDGLSLSSIMENLEVTKQKLAIAVEALEKLQAGYPSDGPEIANAALEKIKGKEK